MSKEKYLSESTIKGTPRQRFSLKLREGSITSDKIADKAIGTQKIQDKAVTIEKLDELLLSLIKSATGVPEDLLFQIEEITKKLSNLENITDTDINKIINGDYEPEDNENVETSNNEQIQYISQKVDILSERQQKSEAKIDNFINSNISTETINNLY